MAYVFAGTTDTNPRSPQASKILLPPLFTSSTETPTGKTFSSID